VWWERVEWAQLFSIKMCKNISSIRGGHVPNWNLTSSKFCFSEGLGFRVEGYAAFGGLYPFLLWRNHLVCLYLNKLIFIDEWKTDHCKKTKAMVKIPIFSFKLLQNIINIPCLCQMRFYEP
jgi:hypothetical protein